MGEIEPLVEGRVRSAIEYMNEGSGKLLRPLYTIHTAKAYGVSLKRSLPIAAAVEMTHNGSLAVDDFQDNDDLRRGRISVPKKFGSDVAILTGIDTFAEVLNLLDRSYISDKDYRTLSKLARETMAGLIDGQDMDCATQKGNNHEKFYKRLSNEERILAIYDGKTGALFDFAVRSGAVLGEADARELTRWQKVGIDTGRILQFGDDFADAFAKKEEMGKATGTDEDGHNAVYLLGKDRAKELRDNAKDSVLKNLRFFRDKKQLDVSPLEDLTEELCNAHEEYVQRGFNAA